MINTKIKHPTEEPLIIIRKWQIEACGGNQAAAALLSFLEYWHNVKEANKTQSRSYNDTAELHGEPRTQYEGVLQWHTAEEIENGILLFKRDAIRKAIRLLEEKGFITVTQNPNPRFHFDKTKHFLLNIDAINSYLESRKIAQGTKENRSSGAYYEKSHITTAENQHTTAENQHTTAENQRAIPEITPKITSENQERIPLPPYGGHEQKSSDDFLKTALEQEPDQGDPVQTEISPEPCPKNQSSGSEKSSAAPPRTNVLGLPIASDLRRQQAIAASIVDSPFESVEQQDDFYSQVWEYVRATNPKLNPGQITGIAKATLKRVSANAPDADDRRILRMWSTGELGRFRNATYDAQLQQKLEQQRAYEEMAKKIRQEYAEHNIFV